MHSITIDQKSIEAVSAGQLDLDALTQLLARQPKLIAVAHVSSVLGTINPLAVSVSSSGWMTR